MAELAPGSVVAGCRIEAVIGRGGMGLVYRATQLSLERPVALKAIAPELAGDATFRERFKRESRIAASIEHPNVIPVYDSGEGKGVLYLIMRYVEGTDLRALIAREGGLDPGRAAGLVAQVAAGLAAAHRRGLVHRDVKPANVLVDGGGGSEHAYLTDFGIARHIAATSGLTRTGAVVGTLDYLAPERIQGDGADGAGADVYALGCVLFETLTGSVPYPRDNEVAKMYAHLNAPVPAARELDPELPAALDEIARRAMAKEPGERFGSAGELAEALAAAAPPAPPLAPPAADSTESELPPTEPVADTDATLPVAPRRRRRWVPVVALSLAVIAAAGTGVILLAGSGGDAPPGPQIVDQIKLGGEPDGVGVGAGAVWIADRKRDWVWRVDPQTNVKRHTKVDNEPDSIAVGRATVWVTNTSSDTVSRLDRAGSLLGAPIATGARPEGVLATSEAVWVANSGDGTVTRIGPDNRPRSIHVGGPGSAPIQLAEGAGKVWVTLSGAHAIVPIDPDSGKAGRRVTVPGLRPRGIAYDPEHGRLWVSSPPHNVLAVVDPKARAAPEQIQVPQDPREVRYGAGAIWVTCALDGSVTRIDPQTRTQSGNVHVSGRPYGLAVGPTTVWVGTMSIDSPSNGLLLQISPR